MKRRVQRSGLDLEQILGRALDVPGDRVAVLGSGAQRAQDQELERALQQLDTGRLAPRHCVGNLQHIL